MYFMVDFPGVLNPFLSPKRLQIVPLATVFDFLESHLCRGLPAGVWPPTILEIRFGGPRYAPSIF